MARDTNAMLREDFLTRLAQGLVKAKIMENVPQAKDLTIKASVGFTTAGARVGRDGELIRAAEAYNPKLSKDGICEIFVSPTETNVEEIARIIIREICKVTLLKSKNAAAPERKTLRERMAECNFKVKAPGGLEDAPLDEAGLTMVRKVIEQVGGADAYVHAAVELRKLIKKPVPTKMFKCYCPQVVGKRLDKKTKEPTDEDEFCPYKFRTTEYIITLAKHEDGRPKLPICPVHNVEMVTDWSSAQRGKGDETSKKRQRNAAGNRSSVRKPRKKDQDRTTPDQQTPAGPAAA